MLDIWRNFCYDTNYHSARRFAIDTYAHLTMAAGLLVPLSPTDEGNCGEYSKLQAKNFD